MSKKKFSRPSLALFTAIALSGGSFFAPSFASGADVTIDSTHPPQRNVPNPDDPSTPNSAASVGTGSEDASGNSLTVNRYQEGTLSVFGGVARGTGNADGNTVRIKGVTTEIASVYGGAAWGIGHARENRVRFDAGTMSFAEWLVGGYVGRSGKAEENTVEVNGGKAESLYGGFSNSTNAAGHIYKNHVIIRNGTVAGKVYGGAFGGAHATGDVTYNTVTITGGTLKKVVCGGSLEKADSTGNVAHNEVTVAGGVFRGDVYGGYTRRGGALTGNIVTITGGELNSVYAANSAGNVSEIKGNVVNLGDGKNEMKAGYRIAKYIFGASGGNRAAYADNTLNVKASARAKNIVNFDKVNFYFTGTLQPRLTLRDSMGTKFKSLKDITIYGSPSTPAGTLIENNTSGGIVVRDGVNTVVRTGDTAEVTLEKDATGRKILYSRLIFKGATTAESDGTHIWGDRSVIGNTTTGNDVALANGSYVNAFGGWTTGAGSDAAADKLGDSTGNKIAVSGTATVTVTVYGGYTDAAGGKARGNAVTVESAVHDVVGGEGAGEASGNIVNVRASAAAVTGGRSAGATSNNRVTLGNITIASVVGGDAATIAEGNAVSLDGTTVANDVIGGRGAAANGNTVDLKDATVNGAIMGGHGTVQSDGNTVSLQNATVNGAVTGGEGATTNNNEVHLNGNARVTGALKGGSQTNGTGNTLSIKGRGNKAGAITDFQKFTFDASGLAKDDTMLEVTGAGETDVDWVSLTATGTAAKPLTLLKNEQGINLARYTGAAKSETGDEAETNIDVRKSGARITAITYEGYRFKGATQATREGRDAYGGRSKAGNSTRENEIALASGTHANVYGGWTSGVGTTAADKGASYENKVKVSGTATVTGTVYGGYTDAAGGKARGNTVTVESAVHDVVGGEGAGEASGNTVNIRANAAAVTGGRGAAANDNIVNLGNVTVASVTGGEGATTNNNEVHLNGNARVTGALKGGSQTNGTGNTLSIKGRGNKAGAITDFQKFTFDASGLAKDDTMLEVTGAGETDVDWVSLTATGTAAKPLTLLKNEQGINLARYTGAAKSETGDEAETNIDVRKSGARITAITYEGYRFKGATQATREGRDAYGGRSKAGNSTRENEIALASGTHANVYGGWTSGVGTTAADKGASYENKVKVSGTATVTGTVYGGYTDAAGGKARGNTVTVESAVHDVVGGEGAGEASGNIVNIRANAAAVTGGRSAGAASNNRVTLGNITIASVVGGDAATIAEGNAVSLDGTTVANDVIGGRGAATNGNTVDLKDATVNGAVMGGHGTAQSDGNTVSLQNATVNGAVTGGYGMATNGNIIHLRNTVVKGIVTGGTASGGVGNTLAVCYSAGTSSIHDFKGIENLRLDVEDAPTDGTAHTLLKLTNVSGGSKNLKNMTLDFRRSGAARKLQAGDSFTLLENASGKITVGEGVTMKGTDGIAHDCRFAIAPDKEHPEKLRATVTKTDVSETAKSPVETRAGLANFVNQGADYLVEIGFAAAELSEENASADDAAESRASAKDTQRRTAASDPASYHLWAGAGANAMRVESGSHVDSKGWNLGVGWAREDAAKDGTKRLFSPFVEYGRSTYDSYLDNGAHGSGKLSYFGLGVLGKLMQQDGLWLEASVRAGRAKSDYSLHGENAGYDGSNAYYGIHLGVGKTFALQKGASLDAYVRYFWSHQDGMSVKLRGSGDAYDFADVDSHRLRLGLRYSRKDRSTGECYAGLAWEHELGGEASASVGGDAAPSPSLKGSSYMLELGYRFLPQNSRVSYDFHINGWQGKRKGLSGGAVIRWAF